MMLVVVAYDVACDRRRDRLAKLLEGFGERVNYSVFQCELRRRQVRELERRMLGLIDLEEDHVRVYELCRDCRERIRRNGRPEPADEGPVVWV